MKLTKIYVKSELFHKESLMKSKHDVFKKLKWSVFILDKKADAGKE